MLNAQYRDWYTLAEQNGNVALMHSEVELAHTLALRDDKLRVLRANPNRAEFQQKNIKVV